MSALLVALLACRCDGGPTHAPAPEAHYADFDHLVDLAAKGDVAPAKALARDLEVADDDATLASATGFVQMALDADELADGVSEMAAACGACHASRGVTATGTRPVFDHEHAARWATWGVVWGATLVAPPAPDEETAPFAAALGGEGEAPARVAKAVATCAKCHSPAR